MKFDRLGVNVNSGKSYRIEGVLRMVNEQKKDAVKLEANISNIINQIIKICIELADISAIILYGSRAKGTHMEKSDIDIALKGNNICTMELLDAIDAIDTLLKIDLIDIDNCKNSLLKKEVEKYGITLFSKT